MKRLVLEIDLRFIIKELSYKGGMATEEGSLMGEVSSPQTYLLEEVGSRGASGA